MKSAVPTIILCFVLFGSLPTASSADSQINGRDAITTKHPPEREEVPGPEAPRSPGAHTESSDETSGSELVAKALSVALPYLLIGAYLVCGIVGLRLALRPGYLRAIDPDLSSPSAFQFLPFVAVSTLISWGILKAGKHLKIEIFNEIIQLPVLLFLFLIIHAPLIYISLRTFITPKPSLAGRLTVRALTALGIVAIVVGLFGSGLAVLTMMLG